MNGKGSQAAYMDHEVAPAVEVNGLHAKFASCSLWDEQPRRAACLPVSRREQHRAVSSQHYIPRTGSENREI
eukprot:1156042-Pelagomonas_calceolata.AAC.5